MRGNYSLGNGGVSPRSSSNTQLWRIPGFFVLPPEKKTLLEHVGNVHGGVKIMYPMSFNCPLFGFYGCTGSPTEEHYAK